MKDVFERYKAALICVILAGATFGVYWQVLRSDFVNFDDPIYVTENEYVNTGFSWENIRWAFTAGKVSYWHPLTWLSHMLDCELYGLRPGLHHLTNLIIHIANSLLVFLVFRGMTGAVWRSAFVAAVFALHPVNVDSVAWVAERKNVLSTLLWFLTMWGYASYVRRGRAGRYLVTLLLFVVGLLAKPMLVTLPFVMLVLDFWPFGRLGGEGNKVKAGEQRSQIFRLVWEKVPFFILSGISIYLSSLSIRRLGITTPMGLVPMKLRIMQALVSYVSYLSKIVLPRKLAVFYPYPDGVAVWRSAVALLFLVCVTFLLVWVFRRKRYAAVGWLWYVGTLVPVIGLVQAGLWPATADRWLYVPAIGVFVVASWGVGEFVGRVRLRRIAVGTAAGVCICTLMVCTWIQLGYWRSGFTLFTRALEVTKDNYIAHLNLGNEYLREKDNNEAIGHYKRAIELHRDYVEAHYNLGIALGLERRYEEAIEAYRRVLRLKEQHGRTFFYLATALARTGHVDEAISYYKKQLEIDAEDMEALSNFGLALVKKGRYEEAIGHYNKALELEPESAGVLTNLGSALGKAGRVEEEIACYRKALSLQSDLTAAHYNLAKALAGQGKSDEAIVEYREALRLRPDDMDAHYGLGLVLEGQGRYDEAVKHYEKAIELNPDFAQSYYSLGVIFANRGQTDEAIEQFREVLRIHPDDAEMHCNIGVLLAQKGALDEAIKEFRTAVGLDPHLSRAREQLEAALERKAVLDGI
ncbi:MAG: tetratricopeptide repeat protein [Planctomycetota bacterium]|nr:MAG: tetratricopeptide repeat protein [Planctomycetota bacterium]